MSRGAKNSRRSWSRGFGARSIISLAITSLSPKSKHTFERSLLERTNYLKLRAVILLASCVLRRPPGKSWSAQFVQFVEACNFSVLRSMKGRSGIYLSKPFNGTTMPYPLLSVYTDAAFSSARESSAVQLDGILRSLVRSTPLGCFCERIDLHVCIPWCTPYDCMPLRYTSAGSWSTTNFGQQVVNRR